VGRFDLAASPTAGPTARVTRRIARAAGVLGVVALLWLLLAADALSARGAPAARWWWTALFAAYLGALVAGVSAYVLLLSRVDQPRRRAVGVMEQACLIPGAGRRILAGAVAALAGDLAPPLSAAAALWLLVGPSTPARPASIMWLHLHALSLGLGLGAVRLWLQERLGAARAAVALLFGALALLMTSAFWAPPALDLVLPSRAYAPALILLNPVLAAATAAGQDLLRHGLWYGGSALGLSRFEYPPAAVAALLPLLGVLLAWALPPWGRYRAA
jgi:hypothetical protein